MPTEIYINVAVPVPLRQLFTYKYSIESDDSPLTKGERLLVPFGNRNLVAIYISEQKESPSEASKIKPIIKRLDKNALYSRASLKFIETVANYYQHPIGDVFHHTLPKFLRTINEHKREPLLQWSVSDQKCDETKLAKAKNNFSYLNCYKKER